MQGKQGGRRKQKPQRPVIVKVSRKAGGTRATNSQSHINASVADANAQVRGAADAFHELKQQQFDDEFDRQMTARLRALGGHSSGPNPPPPPPNNGGGGPPPGPNPPPGPGQPPAPAPAPGAQPAGPFFLTHWLGTAAGYRYVARAGGAVSHLMRAGLWASALAAPALATPCMIGGIIWAAFRTVIRDAILRLLFPGVPQLATMADISDAVAAMRSKERAATTWREGVFGLVKWCFGVRSIAFPIKRCLNQTVGEIRAVHVRANKSVPDSHPLTVYRVYSPQSDDAWRDVVASDDMITTLRCACITTPPAMLRPQLLTTASRVGNMRLPAELHADICVGSSDVATIPLEDESAKASEAKAGLDLEWLSLPKWAVPLAKLGLVAVSSAVLATSAFFPHVIPPWILPGVRAACCGASEEVLKHFLAGWVGRETVAGAAALADSCLRPMTPYSLFQTTLTHFSLLNMGSLEAIALHAFLNYRGQELRGTSVATGIAVFCAVAAAGGVVAYLVSPKTRAPRVVGYGYRAGEFDPGELNPAATAKVTLHANFTTETERRPMQVSLGPHLKAAALPIADSQHGPTIFQGAMHRVFRDNDLIVAPVLVRLRAFVKQWLDTNLDPIQSGTCLDELEWLARTKYSKGRKGQIIEALDENFRFVGERTWHCEGHGKRECLTAYKTCRAIISRSDKAKAFFGPAIKTIEGVVYSRIKAFIKHVPCKDRPEYLLRMFGISKDIHETDYTSFEGSFQPLILEVECMLYEHMLMWYPTLAGLMKAAFMGKNVCKFKTFTVHIFGKRMSGEMSTSLGNGFMNLMLSLFMGADPERIVVEGDDALYCGQNIDATIPAQLGFRLKLERRESVLTSKFCGLMLSDDLISMTDPRKVLAGFGWTHSPLMQGGPSVLRQLLRAKSLSLMYEHPRCPILYMLSRRFKTLTSDVVPRWQSGWYEQHLQSEIADNMDWAETQNSMGPSDCSRFAFAECFGIPVDMQLRIEDYLSSAPVGELDHPDITWLMHELPQWQHYRATYVWTDDVRF